MRNGWLPMRLATHCNVVGSADGHPPAKRVLFWVRPNVRGKPGWQEFGSIYFSAAGAGLIAVPEHSHGCKVVAFKLIGGGP